MPSPSTGVYEIQSVDDEKDPYPKLLSEDIVAKFPFRLLVCGDSQSGKTTFFMNLLTKFFFPFFDYIWAFAYNHDVDPAWIQVCNKVPNKLDTDSVCKDYSDEKLQRILDFVQQNFTTRQKSAKHLIIFDDQAGDYSCMQSKLLAKMNMWMRHLNIAPVCLTQSYMRVGKTVRIQASVLAFFNTKNHRELETIQEEVCPSWLPKKRFREVYNMATMEPYSFLYVKNDEKEPKMRFRKNLTELIEYDEEADPLSELNKSKKAMGSGAHCPGCQCADKKTNKKRKVSEGRVTAEDESDSKRSKLQHLRTQPLAK